MGGRLLKKLTGRLRRPAAVVEELSAPLGVKALLSVGVCRVRLCRKVPGVIIESCPVGQRARAQPRRRVFRDPGPLLSMPALEHSAACHNECESSIVSHHFADARPLAERPNQTKQCGETKICNKTSCPLRFSTPQRVLKLLSLCTHSCS